MTRILTLTEPEALTLTVRGDVPGVLDGYVGPVIWGERTERIALGRAHEGYALVVADASAALSHWASVADLHLPLANPLVQAHLVGWLGRGAVCPYCKNNPRPKHLIPDGDPDDPCSGCDGVGWIRPRHNRFAWLLPEAHGGLPDWIRLALIWGSVVRVAAGMSALEEVLSPWWRDGDRDKCGRGYAGGCRPMSAISATWFGNLSAEERAAFDAEVIREPVALIDNTPEGRVIRFEVPNG